jgi:hypothetical protein
MDAARTDRGIESLLHLRFGAEGNATHYLGAGWSAGEPDGRWMIGQGTELWLENPGPGGDLLLEVEVGLMHLGTADVHQRLVVGVRGQAVAQIVVRRPGALSFHVPAALAAEPGPLRVVFLHPDCRRPSEIGGGPDDRELSINMRTLRLSRVAPRPVSTPGPALPLAEMVTRFESLGDNCEFGLVQRRLGAEPLGLCRFSFIEQRSLLAGLRSGFARLADPGTVDVTVEGPDQEFIVRETVYGMTYHTFETADRTDMETVRARQVPRLKFLRRKLMEDVAAGTRIFVLKRNEPLPPEEVLTIYTALNEHGRNWLLWMVNADATHAAGTVEQLLPGLLRGFIDRFAPAENAHDLSLDVWRSVVEGAWRIAGGSLGEPEG